MIHSTSCSERAQLSWNVTNTVHDAIVLQIQNVRKRLDDTSNSYRKRHSAKGDLASPFNWPRLVNNAQ